MTSLSYSSSGVWSSGLIPYPPTSRSTHYSRPHLRATALSDPKISAKYMNTDCTATIFFSPYSRFFSTLGTVKRMRNCARSIKYNLCAIVSLIWEYSRCSLKGGGVTVSRFADVSLHRRQIEKLAVPKTCGKQKILHQLSCVYTGDVDEPINDELNVANDKRQRCLKHEFVLLVRPANVYPRFEPSPLSREPCMYHFGSGRIFSLNLREVSVLMNVPNWSGRRHGMFICNVI
jgi:hypothetical protein